eukprot:7096606-Heterocapsa_arctica.AAC.1
MVTETSTVRLCHESLLGHREAAPLLDTVLPLEKLVRAEHRCAHTPYGRLEATGRRQTSLPPMRK